MARPYKIARIGPLPILGLGVGGTGTNDLGVRLVLGTSEASACRDGASSLVLRQIDRVGDGDLSAGSGAGD